MTRMLLSLAFTVSALPALAAVEETSSMATALSSAGPDTLVVLDIDNTLLQPVGYLGGDAWYEFLVQRAVREGLTRDAAIDRAMTAFNDAQYAIDVRAVEPATPALVKEAHARGARVIALTARTPDIAPRTLAQLDHIGVGFSVIAKPDIAPKGTRLDQGVLFVGDHLDKGEMLVALLRASRLQPKRVIFVDDKQRHAESVDRALAKAGIPCRSFRYGAADADVERFWRDVGDVRFLVDGQPSPETTKKITQAKVAP